MAAPAKKANIFQAPVTIVGNSADATSPAANMKIPKRVSIVDVNLEVFIVFSFPILFKYI